MMQERAASAQQNRPIQGYFRVNLLQHYNNFESRRKVRASFYLT